MTQIPHWRMTVAMVAAYLPVAALVLLFLHDAVWGVLLLFVAFFLILLAGNIVLRRRAAAPAAKTFAGGAGRPPASLADPELSVRRPPEGRRE